MKYLKFGAKCRWKQSTFADCSRWWIDSTFLLINKCHIINIYTWYIYLYPSVALFFWFVSCFLIDYRMDNAEKQPNTINQLNYLHFVPLELNTQFRFNVLIGNFPMVMATSVSNDDPLTPVTRLFRSLPATSGPPPLHSRLLPVEKHGTPSLQYYHNIINNQLIH